MFSVRMIILKQANDYQLIKSLIRAYHCNVHPYDNAHPAELCQSQMIKIYACNCTLYTVSTDKLCYHTDCTKILEHTIELLIQNDGRLFRLSTSNTSRPTSTNGGTHRSFSSNSGLLLRIGRRTRSSIGGAVTHRII